MSNDIKVVQQKEVEFQDATLLGIEGSDGNIYVGMQWIGQGIGFTKSKIDNEIRKAKKDDVLKGGVKKLNLQFETQVREALCINIDYLPLWLANFSITPTVKEKYPGAVEKMKQFKIRAKDVLAEAFIKNGVTEERIRKKSDSEEEFNLRMDIKAYLEMLERNPQDRIAEIQLEAKEKELRQVLAKQELKQYAQEKEGSAHMYEEHLEGSEDLLSVQQFIQKYGLPISRTNFYKALEGRVFKKKKKSSDRWWPYSRYDKYFEFYLTEKGNETWGIKPEGEQFIYEELLYKGNLATAPEFKKFANKMTKKIGEKMRDIEFIDKVNRENIDPFKKLVLPDED